MDELATTQEELFGSDSSDDEDVTNVPPRKQTLQSTDEQNNESNVANNNTESKLTAKDLFGSDIEDDHESEDELQQSRHDMKEAEEEEEEEVLPKDPEAKLMCLGAIQKPSVVSGITSVRLPKTASYAQSAFDNALYDEEQEQKELFDKGKLHASENIVRWRFQRDATGDIVLDSQGKPKCETNTRIVKWSDGSFTLHIGREIYSFSERTDASDLNHLFVRQTSYSRTQPDQHLSKDVDEEACLEGVGRIQRRYLLRPFQTSSMTSKKAILAARQRGTTGSSGIMTTEVSTNPELEKERRVKQLEDVWRTEQRQQEASRQAKQTARRASRRVTAAYLEEGLEDEEDVEYEDVTQGGLGDMRRAIRAGLHDDDDDDDMQEEEEELQTSDVEMSNDEGPTQAPSGARGRLRRRAVVEEESDDEA